MNWGSSIYNCCDFFLNKEKLGKCQSFNEFFKMLRYGNNLWYTIEIFIMCLKLVILSSNSIKLRTKLKNEDEQIPKGKMGKKINWS
jgi:heme exporter protein D